MRRCPLKFLSLVIFFSLTACITESHESRIAKLEPCADWVDFLGESHHCSNSDGGAMGPDMVRREITQKVIIDGYPLVRQEYGLSAFTFNYDGSYQARKLRFTGYYEETRGEKIYLVYAEDSKGEYEVEDDGSITMKRPSYSTCDDRTSGFSSDTIRPHVQFFPRRQPYRTSIDRQTSIVFEAKGWLGEFLGLNYLSGTIESRTGFKMPPFPKQTDYAYTYDFDGFKGDIYYGCLHKGFEDFEGKQKEKIVTVEEFQYEKGVNPKDLRPGTKMIRFP